MTRGQSISSSTRTFQTPPPSSYAPPAEVPKPPKIKTARQPLLKLKISLNLPWLIVVVLVATSIFLFVQYRDAKQKLSSPKAAAANTAQTASVVAKVSKLVIVPANETPTVATVASADKLKSQTFFANAQNGDKVVVYSKEKEAILYRPSTNQIVTISSVDVAPSTSQSSAQ